MTEIALAIKNGLVSSRLYERLSDLVNAFIPLDADQIVASIPIDNNPPFRSLSTSSNVPSISVYTSPGAYVRKIFNNIPCSKFKYGNKVTIKINNGNKANKKKNASCAPKAVTSTCLIRTNNS